VGAIAALADAEYCYLTTTGRRSGALHRIEIWFVAHDDAVYLLSNSEGADWYRNLLARPEVTLEIADERRQTAARPVEASDPANGVVRAAMVEKYQAGYSDDLSGWSREASLVRIEWAPAS
jgi:deazaflavin-dependent oxidoreductase (nitroreductase family)